VPWITAHINLQELLFNGTIYCGVLGLPAVARTAWFSNLEMTDQELSLMEEEYERQVRSEASEAL
jgi:hypothetical protein